MVFWNVISQFCMPGIPNMAHDLLVKKADNTTHFDGVLPNSAHYLELCNNQCSCIFLNKVANLDNFDSLRRQKKKIGVFCQIYKINIM